MTTPLAAALARWLASRPGPITGDSREDCYAKAQTRAGMDGVVSTDAFTETLVRVGYEAQARMVHDATKKRYWILCLPEQQAGSTR